LRGPRLQAQVLLECQPGKSPVVKRPGKCPRGRRYYTADAYVLTCVPRFSSLWARRATTRVVKSGFNVGIWLVFVQEHPLGVQSTVLPEPGEDSVHVRRDRDRPHGC